MQVAQLEIKQIVAQQRQFFETGKTKNIAFRIAQLKILRQAILEQESAILAALKADLNKAEAESYLAEIRTIQDISYAIKNLPNWAKPQKVSIPLESFPGAARIYSEPLGTVLIISPWNYPFYLLIAPLIGAIAAGNCAVLKPSELAPNTSNLIADLIAQNFDPGYITTVLGDAEVGKQLLDQKFDYIFFTGSNAVGKVVMAAAAKNLTPVTLELGGKSPCIVDNDVNLEVAAKRITWGKFINAGQTCIAPDYLLVQRAIKSDLLAAIQKNLLEFFGENPEQSPDYCRIINQKHFNRLMELLKSGKIVNGAIVNLPNPATRYIPPTILDDVSPSSPVMQEEIFGPILPVIVYDSLEEAIAFVNQRPKPLALYFFSRNQQHQNQVLQATSSGGVCINDILLHLTVPELPFGGVGQSGMGSYHGKASFDTFSHQKSVLIKPFWFDIFLRYQPYKNKLRWLKYIIR
jgi:acyl-CoA reductase-like NAD-dependent aldehyde dehydrogenase